MDEYENGWIREWVDTVSRNDVGDMDRMDESGSARMIKGWRGSSKDDEGCREGIQGGGMHDSR